MCMTFPLREWYVRGREAYLASQHESRREAYREGWLRFEREYGFDFDHDLLAHLGQRIIIHDFPPHPLAVPLLWTYLVETDGDVTAVRRAVDGMMRAWQSGLPKADGETASGGGFVPEIRRTDDGIWYLQLGLAGPAIGVADHWIVISFSPAAVRENLRRLDAASTPASSMIPR